MLVSGHNTHINDVTTATFHRKIHPKVVDLLASQNAKKCIRRATVPRSMPTLVLVLIADDDHHRLHYYKLLAATSSQTWPIEHIISLPSTS